MKKRKNYYRCNSNSFIWLEQYETRYNLLRIGLLNDIRLFSFAYRDVRTCKCNLNYIASRLISFTGIISDYCYLISTSFNIRTYNHIDVFLRRIWKTETFNWEKFWNKFNWVFNWINAKETTGHYLCLCRGSGTMLIHGICNFCIIAVC